MMQAPTRGIPLPTVPISPSTPNTSRAKLTSDYKAFLLIKNPLLVTLIKEPIMSLPTIWLV